jgi:hypothetical protein
VTWTVRRMPISLVFALLLGVAAITTHFTGEHQRQWVIDHGFQTTAAVTDLDKSDRWVDRSEITYHLDGVEQRTWIYGIWNDTLPLGTDLVVYLDRDDPSLVVTENRHTTDMRTVLPAPLALLAFVVAFVAVTNRLTAARRRKWAAAELGPEPAPGSVAIRHRGVVRRVDVLSRSMIGLLAVGMPLGVWANWQSLGPLDYTLVAMMTALMAGLFLLGMAGKVVVTPGNLTIHQAFTVIAVPRHLVRSVRLADDGVLRLDVGDALSISIPTGAASLWGAYLNRRPAQLRAANRLRNLMIAVPAAESDGGVRKSYRYFMIAVAVLAIVGFIGPVWLVSSLPL